MSFDILEIPDPEQLLAEYVMQTNTHIFANLAPLIAEDAVFGFSDGNHIGRAAIGKAFENTWATIKEEYPT